MGAKRIVLCDTHEKFCQAYVENGGNGVEAILAAYPHRAATHKRETLKRQACTLKKKVWQRIVELRTEIFNERIATREELLSIASEIARNSVKDSARVGAINTVAKIQGYEQALKVEHSGAVTFLKLDDLRNAGNLHKESAGTVEQPSGRTEP